jgi:hypothetical protein
MLTFFQPAPILQTQRPSVRLSTLEHGERRRAPLSRPAPHRSTPTATTGPSFTVHLDSEGAMSVRLVA